MPFLTVTNMIAKPQDPLPSKKTYCLDADGTTIKVIDVKKEFERSYLILFFFTLGNQSDSDEVLKFSASLEKFNELRCKVVGVTSDSPLAIKRWMEKSSEEGGFGKVLGYDVVSDKDLSLSMELGVARTCGLPARATFIISPNGLIRYSMIQRSEVSRNIQELLRLVSAFKTSDETGMATPAGWQPGDKDLIPTDYTEKAEYYRKKYGEEKKLKADIHEGVNEQSSDVATTSSNSDQVKENKKEEKTELEDFHYS